MEIDCLKYMWTVYIQEMPTHLFEIMFKKQDEYLRYEFKYCSYDSSDDYMRKVREYICKSLGKDFKYRVLGVDKDIKVCHCEINDITEEQIVVIAEKY